MNCFFFYYASVLVAIAGELLDFCMSLSSPWTLPQLFAPPFCKMGRVNPTYLLCLIGISFNCIHGCPFQSNRSKLLNRDRELSQY